MSIDDTSNNTTGWLAIEVGVLGEGMERFPIHIEKLGKIKDGPAFAAAVERVLKDIYGEDVPKNQVRLFLTDGATPMTRCGKILKQTYPKMIHVQCIANKINNVAVLLRKKCPELYKFTGLLKQVLALSRKRNDLFVSFTGITNYISFHTVS